jgi:hypothetical protein
LPDLTEVPARRIAPMAGAEAAAGGMALRPQANVAVGAVHLRDAEYLGKGVDHLRPAVPVRGGTPRAVHGDSRRHPRQESRTSRAIRVDGSSPLGRRVVRTASCVRPMGVRASRLAAEAPGARPGLLEGVRTPMHWDGTPNAGFSGGLSGMSESLFGGSMSAAAG